MRITQLELSEIRVPLKTPFKTALRTVDCVNDIIVKITTDTGHAGYGEAPPTAVITGDTKGSIVCAIRDFIAPAITGMEISNLEGIMDALHSCIVRNTSAKAAVDMAIYDLYGQLHNAPVYKLLGGYRNEITTDITISLNSAHEMIADSLQAVEAGYSTLKIKVGKEREKDLETIKEIRKAVGSRITLRIDANQGWQPKEAVRIIRGMEEASIDIELVEQPVAAHDILGLKYVTDNVFTPILADEAVFSPENAVDLIKMRAADFINIKLMKTGGIYNALKLCSIAETYGVACMMGCMLESRLSVSAAAHLAAARRIITMVDLDGAALCAADAVEGGPVFEGNRIIMPEKPGLGFEYIKEEFCL